MTWLPWLVLAWHRLVCTVRARVYNCVACAERWPVAWLEVTEWWVDYPDYSMYGVKRPRASKPLCPEHYRHFEDIALLEKELLGG